jgi:hypothetical protein
LESNKYRAQAPSENAPDSAAFFHSALMHGELFDIKIARAMGILAFGFDIAIQWQNRYWGDSGTEILISGMQALLMLVGMELLMVIIRVEQGTRYPAQAQSAGAKTKAASSSEWTYVKENGVEYRYKGNNVEAKKGDAWVKVKI